MIYVLSFQFHVGASPFRHALAQLHLFSMLTEYSMMLISVASFLFSAYITFDFGLPFIPSSLWWSMEIYLIKGTICLLDVFDANLFSIFEHMLQIYDVNLICLCVYFIPFWDPGCIHMVYWVSSHELSTDIAFSTSSKLALPSSSEGERTDKILLSALCFSFKFIPLSLQQSNRQRKLNRRRTFIFFY